ncbi:MAG: UbiX family flavin prenyltransferase [Candidatus Kapaibacterium sp.]
MDQLENPDIAVPKTETRPLVKPFKGDGRNVILGITGTSGAIYAIRTLRALIVNNFNVALIITEYGHYTLTRECGMELTQSNIQSFFPELIVNKCSVSFHSNLDLKSEIFSSSYNAYGVIVVPCAMSYVSQIANGECQNLIVKCADYAMSYSKPLIVVPRETPVNRIQLGNMIKILDAGGKIAPAMPSFENNPKDINDLADFIAGKVLDLLMNGRE